MATGLKMHIAQIPRKTMLPKSETRENMEIYTVLNIL